MTYIFAKTLYFAIAVLAAVILISVIASGCAAPHPTPTAAQSVVTAVTATPVALQATAKTLDWFIALAVIGVGVGVGLYFLLPTHNLSFAIAAISGGIEGSALLTRVTLWLVPWVAGALLLSAVGFFAYEVYVNRTKIQADISKAI